MSGLLINAKKYHPVKKARQASLKIKFVHSNSVNSEEVHLGKLHVRKKSQSMHNEEFI